MLGRFTQPLQDRIFFDPFGTRQTADPAAFGQQSQGFQDLILGSPLAKQQSSLRRRERLATGFALVTLDPSVGCLTDKSYVISRFCSKIIAMGLAA